MPLIRNNMATSKVAVDKYIGTSYDVIKTVYDNLAEILTTATAIDEGTISDTLFQIEIERQTGSQAVARLFTFATITYGVALDNINVYRNGQRLDLTDDYTEPSSTTVLLTFDPNAADKFVFITNERTDTANIANASNVSYAPVGTGAVTTTVQTKLAEGAVSVKDFGAVGDGVTDDSAAVVAFFAAVTAGAAGYIPNGVYWFSTEVVVTGKRRQIVCDTDAQLWWKGIKGADAITFGDGGTTVTENLNVTNLQVVDGEDAGGVAMDACIVLDSCNRSQFYNLYTRGNNHVSGGAGLVFRGTSILNDFFKYKSVFTNKGILFDDNSNIVKTTFYAAMIEGNGEAGVDVGVPASTTQIIFHASTFEGIDGAGVHFRHPPSEWVFDGCYWESCELGSILDDHSSAGKNVVVKDCRHKGGTRANASIIISSATKYIITNNSYTDQNLVELADSGAKVELADNHTATGWTFNWDAPTYVSGTVFTIPGDMTALFSAGIRCQAESTPTVEGTISTAVFGAGVTTVTVAWDSGSIDTDISRVSTASIQVVETSNSKWTETAIDGNGYYEINTGAGVAQLDDSNLVNEARLALTTAAALINSTDGITLQEWYDEHKATVNITAYAGGGQANAVLLSTEISEIDTVATTGDSVRLPVSAERPNYVGVKRTIINAGANALDVFPGTGNDIGAGTNVAVSLAAGANITYVNYSAILWTAQS